MEELHSGESLLDQVPGEPPPERSLIAHPVTLSLTGFALAVGGFASYFALLARATIRATAWPTFAMLGLAVLLSAVAIRLRPRWWTFGAAAVNAGIAGFFTYLFFIDFALPPPQAGPRIGQAAPDFTLMDHTGLPVALEVYRERGPVLLMFYRGHW